MEIASKESEIVVSPNNAYGKQSPKPVIPKEFNDTGAIGKSGISIPSEGIANDTSFWTGLVPGTIKKDSSILITPLSKRVVSTPITNVCDDESILIWLPSLLISETL